MIKTIKPYTWKKTMESFRMIPYSEHRNKGESIRTARMARLPSNPVIASSKSMLLFIIQILETTIETTGFRKK